MYLTDKLKFVGKITYLGNDQEFTRLCGELYEKKWITYIKSPFGGPEQVLEYLGRYTHRVAISNNRILKLENGNVTFQYRDYQDGHKTKEMELEVFEFIRRFLLHVLPCKYFKIRYYGLFSNRNRKKKIEISKKLLGVTKEKESSRKPESWEELLLKLTGVDPRVCPCCGEGIMVRKDELSPVINPPPPVKSLP